MTIVIVGAKERNTQTDRELVYALIDLAAKRYPSCIFVTTMSGVGVGKFVKEKCLEKNSRQEYKYQFIDVDLRIYATGLSPAEASMLYIARNATLFELGDVFLYLGTDVRRGPLEDLIQKRVEPSGRLYRVFLPGDTEVELP